MHGEVAADSRAQVRSEALRGRLVGGKGRWRGMQGSGGGILHARNV